MKRKLVPPAAWVPVGITSFEPAAREVVRSTSNILVVAGPGAGKTELLAQRACFLLQTGLCLPPRQILAISFKTDAAANLGERVRKRCGDELSRRFHSMTFAGFSKSLVDRFREALPEEYRPTADYLINYDIKKRMGTTLDDLVGGFNGLTRAEVATLDPARLYGGEFVGRALPISTAAPRTVSNRAAEAAWRLLLTNRGRSQLDFDMIGRLAELLLRINPLLLAALRQTYSHVFLDEFQDTTRVQFALTRAMFRGSPAIVTAVGDSKQSIMRWAGAVENVFDLFLSDFSAERRDLVMNYRSAPRLVQIQQTLIAALEPGAPPTVAADDGATGEGECRVLLYADERREASHLAEFAHEWVFSDGVEPRDICVLTKNKPAEYVDVLVEELAKKGIKARVETELQDLVVEPIAQLGIDALSLAVRGSDRDAWTSLVELIRGIRGLDEGDPRVRRIERELTSACATIRAAVASPGVTLDELRSQLTDFLAFVGPEAFRRLYPQYLQESFCTKVFEGYTDYLWKCFEAEGDWPRALTAFSGAETVPIITVHKSKGLEYHTVVFMGLEDSAFWSFASQSAEDMRSFFVAFSRAKKRVLFTFCKKRAKAGGRNVSLQHRKQIGVLYDLLKQAGVEAEEVE